MLLYKKRKIVTKKTSHHVYSFMSTVAIYIFVIACVGKLLLQGPHYLRPGSTQVSPKTQIVLPLALQRLPVPFQYLSHLSVPILFNLNESCQSLYTPTLHTCGGWKN